MSQMDMWTYRDETWTGTDLTGFEVEAIDGGIGKVDEAPADVGGAYLVIDTGPWIFGKKVMLPAGVVDHVDVEERKIYVNRTKDDVKSSPEFDPTRHREQAYRDELGGYYGGLGTGPGDDF